MARYIDANKLIGQMLLEKSAYEYRLSVMKDENMRNMAIEIDIRSSIDELGRCVKMVKQAPAADVESVKHGEWVPVTYTYFGLKRYECSECRDDEYWQKRYLEHKEKFCPNCGADMRGDK